MNNKAVFIDKDGTLIKNIPYNVNPDLIELNKHATQSLSVIKKLGYKIIVISNQSGIARGFFNEKDLRVAQQRLFDLLKEEGVILDDFYFCPHYPQGVIAKYSIICECRKPKIGLLKKAAKDHNIDLFSSFLIGDILDDVEPGNKSGCKTILINSGSETKWLFNKDRIPGFIVSNLLEAVIVIISSLGRKYFLKERYA